MQARQSGCSSLLDRQFKPQPGFAGYLAHAFQARDIKPAYDEEFHYLAASGRAPRDPVKLVAMLTALFFQIVVDLEAKEEAF